MKNVERCWQDGFSTGDGSGNGLGAVRRLSAECDLYSLEPTGTVIVARVVEKPAGPPVPEPFTWGVVNRPAPNEVRCGDAWRVAQRPAGFAIMVADGLGHGPQAADAADEAAAVFEGDPFAPLTSMIGHADMRMRGTRGAAVAAARIDAQSHVMKYVGVGNIAGHLRTCDADQRRGLVSHNGTVGAQMRKVQEFDYVCGRQSLLVMHSDGLQNRWTLESYPGLIFRHPAVVAGILYRDFTRGYDDVTVAVVRMSLA